MASVFLLLEFFVLAYLTSAQEICIEPPIGDCNRVNFPSYDVLFDMYLFCEPVPSGEPCYINTQDTIQCQNLSLSRYDQSPPAEGEGFKLSALTGEEICEVLVPKVLGVAFEYGGCPWGDQIPQRDTILLDPQNGWTVVSTGYYHSIACSFVRADVAGSYEES